MPKKEAYDAVVVGAGPNGLAAAITLAQEGRSVLVLEAASTLGGGMRSAQLTLPGFVHDICSAVHPLGVGSPFFSGLPLAQHGLEWIYPPASLAHPLDDGPPVLLKKSIEATGEYLGRDAETYRRVVEPLVKNWDKYAKNILGPLRFPAHPLAMGEFGLRGIWPAKAFAEVVFREPRARAFLAGMSAHSILSLNEPATAAFGIVLGVLGHVVGWPIPKGGSQHIANALGSYLTSLGGEIETSVKVTAIDELPPARAILFDLTPRQVLSIAGKRFPDKYRRSLEKFRYGAGVFKVDYALDGPVPWKSDECLQAGTVHLGGTLQEIAASEKAVAKGKIAEKPYVLVTQQSLFDQTRAPEGKHTLWAYCHVPNGSKVDMTSRIEAQLERFAPGFRERILSRHTMSPANFEDYNSNYIGGDINGGRQDIGQLFTRPVWRLVPYSTPAKGIYICSSSTPPGGGVHGMCGYFAAKAALKDLF